MECDGGQNSGYHCQGDRDEIHRRDPRDHAKRLETDHGDNDHQRSQTQSLDPSHLQIGPIFLYILIIDIRDSPAEMNDGDGDACVSQRREEAADDRCESDDENLISYIRWIEMLNWNTAPPRHIEPRTTGLGHCQHAHDHGERCKGEVEYEQTLSRKMKTGSSGI